jgi:hypothetical protein
MNHNSVESAVAILVSGFLGFITLYSGFRGRDLNAPSMLFALCTLLPSALARANLSHRSLFLGAIQSVANGAWTMAFLLTWFTLKEMAFVQGVVNLVICIVGLTACFMFQNHPGFAVDGPWPVVAGPDHFFLSRCRGG